MKVGKIKLTEEQWVTLRMLSREVHLSGVVIADTLNCECEIIPSFYPNSSKVDNRDPFGFDDEKPELEFTDVEVIRHIAEGAILKDCGSDVIGNTWHSRYDAVNFLILLPNSHKNEWRKFKIVGRS